MAEVIRPGARFSPQRPITPPRLSDLDFGYPRGYGRGFDTVVAWDRHTGFMWIKTKRILTYTCSKGETHRSYWRTHWRQGRDDFVACDHEVTT